MLHYDKGEGISLRIGFSCLLAACLSISSPSTAQCIDDGAAVISPQLDFDALFRSLDDRLSADFPAWQTRYNQENTTDPSPGFAGEDNSQNGIEDDDHLDLVAAIIDGEPVATALGGLDAGEVASIRSSFQSNRARVEGDLTFTVLGLVQVSIIGEIEAGDLGFAETLKDLVAAYMTIGDAESLAFIRGFLITLSDIFIEQGVANGDIPAFVEGATKSAMRSAVNGNFVTSKYQCYGDAPGATQANILGDTGNVNDTGSNNETAYAQVSGDRAAWMLAKGITRPTIEFLNDGGLIEAQSGETFSLVVPIQGGNGVPSADWKRYNANTMNYERVSTSPNLFFPYPLPADSGEYVVVRCDDQWTRVSGVQSVVITQKPFAIVQQPADLQLTQGSSGELSVVVEGGSIVPTFQWYKGATPTGLTLLDGATASTLSFPNASPADAGYYAVVAFGKNVNGLNLTSRTAQVTLTDNPPEIVLIGANPLTLECGAQFSEPGYTAIDDLDGSLTQQVTIESDVDTGAAGEYTVTYRVSDSGGKTAEAVRSVVVEDTLPPSITLVGANPLAIACGSSFSDPGATASDSCVGVLDGAIQFGGTVNTQVPGTYTRTYSVSDLAENSAQVTRQVSVVDNVDPIVTLMGGASVTLECGTEFIEPGYTATDACSGDVSNSITVSGTVDAGSPGDYVLTYTAIDAAGNTGTTMRTVTVQDTQAPSIALLGGSTIEMACGGTFDDPGATAQDGCDGDVTDAISTESDLNTSATGSYTVTYSVVDMAGNTSQATRTVVVADSTPPVITLTGANPLVLECGDAFTEPGPTATDGCDGELTDDIEADGIVDTATPGTYTRTYTVADSQGNEAAATREVQVVDTTPPVLTLLGSEVVMIPCGTEFDDPGATAADVCEGALAVETETVGVSGGLLVYYTAADAAGNSATVSREVRYEDTAAPVVTLAGESIVTIECGTPFVEPGFTASDDCSGDLTNSVFITGAVDVRRPGEYTLSYQVIDDRGFDSEIVRRTVVVRDTQPPLVILTGVASITLDCGAVFLDPGATATDACDGNLTSAIVKQGAVDTARPGRYVVIYSVQDSSGQFAQAQRTVVVRNNCPLEIVAQPQSITVYEGRSAFFRVVAKGGQGPLTYTWRKDGAEVGQGTAGELNIASVLVSDAGDYTCDISDGATTVTTQAATLTVVTPPEAGFHTADRNNDWTISLGELLRVIQLYSFGAMQCSDNSEDGYARGVGDTSCTPHASDYAPQDWRIGLEELLRLVQFYNASGGAYRAQPGTEDDFASGAGS
ncbi:MAG: DUF5011 domain-containing protein [Candidatus Hydrogenedens sp.]|nr:DUF5011 domain-containing protein [Candidatus Hydrogenedens sp.]